LKDCSCEDGSDGWEVVGEDALELTEEGGGRYRKSFFGFKLEVEVSCPTCEVSETVVLGNKVAASEMEELA
jgi:hypothetical protein